jgi:hypothetical protein
MTPTTLTMESVICFPQNVFLFTKWRLVAVSQTGSRRSRRTVVFRGAVLIIRVSVSNSETLFER